MVQNQLNISAKKITVLPIAGVDTARFSPVNETHSEYSAKQINIVTIGRLVEQKGYFDLIECARRVGDEFHFWIIGTGPLREELEQSAPRNVTFLGRVGDADLVKKLSMGDIYFQPSKHEGLCMTVIEAMSCGLPVIGSSVGGIPESVATGITGFLCEPEDIGCFTDRIEELGSDPALRHEMGTAGRERVINQYSRAMLVKKFKDAVQGPN